MFWHTLRMLRRSMDRVKHLDLLTGTPVLSLATANKLGKIHDVFVDPLNGRLAGISIQRENEAETALVYYAQIHSIGPDAVMIVGEESLLSAGESQLKDLPLAKSQLIGVKVLTEDGQFVGKISDIILRMVDPPDFIYEVRSSIFDKLLG